MPEERLIDADALIDKLDIMISDAILSDTAIHYGLIRELVAEQPAIEAEPVIHCKDCAFWERKRVSCEGLARCRTGESGYRCRFGHDFCSRAQRREEVSEDVGTD